MQPPTEPTTALRGDEDELFRIHHRDLHRAVARVVSAPRELIEDACQTAWTTLLRVQPDRYAIFAWLRVVAIHEAYRLSALDRRAARVHQPGRDDGEGPQMAADPRSLEDAVEALEALRVVASLPKRQRQDFALQIAGHSYEEIRARTPDRTMTNVSKSLAKARNRIREARNRRR